MHCHYLYHAMTNTVLFNDDHFRSLPHIDRDQSRPGDSRIITRTLLLCEQGWLGPYATRAIGHKGGPKT